MTGRALLTVVHTMLVEKIGLEATDALLRPSAREVVSLDDRRAAVVALGGEVA